MHYGGRNLRQGHPLVSWDGLWSTGAVRGVEPCNSLCQAIGAIRVHRAVEEPGTVVVPGHQRGINGALLKKLCDLRKGYCTTRVEGAVEDDLLLLWPELPHDAARNHDLWCNAIGPDHRELPSSRGKTCLGSVEIVVPSVQEEVHSKRRSTSTYLTQNQEPAE